MVALETFSTEGLTPRRKIEFWNDTACASFTPMVTDPSDLNNFNGRLSRTSVGELSFAEVYSDAQVVRHLRSHAARVLSPMFFVHMMIEGNSISRQDGREARLGPGDFTLCDTTRPYEIFFENPNRMFVVGIPETALRQHLSSPESVVAVPMPGGNGLNGLLSRFLRDFWTRCQDELGPVAAPQVTRAILDLLASAYSTLPEAQSDRSSIAAAHRIRIVDFIEAHLGDPDLTPLQVADACKITPRYLHHLFSTESQTVSRYILKRRLDECSRALTLPSQRDRTVTEIAFEYGFNSPTHFGRVFRSRFGVTPREFRSSREPALTTRPRTS